MRTSVDSRRSFGGSGRHVVIVGGGVMGAATACFLARDHGLAVTILERDPLYRQASSALSASSIRQQFSTEPNIALSRWSLDFLRRLAQELAIPGESPPHIGLVEPGYLYLASTTGVEVLRDNHAVQRQAGADVALLGRDALKARFPWMQVDDVALGSLGVSGEGWFDGPALHQAFRRKAQSCGVRMVKGQVQQFKTEGERVVAAITDDGQHWPCDAIVLTAGAWTAPLAQALGAELPVVPKKRDVFVLDCPVQELPGCPLVIDPSGVWFRPEGRGFLAGAPPRSAADGGPGDPDEPPLHAIDHALFEAVIWPTLAHRVPAFEALRVRSAWAGYYEMNTFDHNGLAGALPGWRNAYAACGFSGHGMQQAPAVGCALAAMVAQVDNPAVTLAPFDPQRVVLNQPLLERNVI
jgi:glycine/D-amino acid oxidase-like deaminating enzyme